MIKVLHISDTHGMHCEMHSLPHADIIVHSGDFCKEGTENEVIDFIEWFDSLDYKHVKQLLQEFIYCCGTSSRWGGQTVFSNITLDIKCPEDLKEKPVLIGGVDTGTTYKDYQAEMDVINLALLDVMSEGDKDGRPFA